MSGDISSSIAGGNFWSGVRQGLITSGLNHVAHSMLEQYPMVEKPVEQMTEQEIIQANMNNLLEFNKNLLDGYMLLEGAKGVWGLKDFVINGGKKIGSSISGWFAENSANSNTKFISQFSTSSIDEAVALTMKQKGTHIFANKLHPKSYLDELSKQMGGHENVIRSALQKANGRLPTSGMINDLPVNVGGMQLYIKGYINNGKPIINSLHNGSLW